MSYRGVVWPLRVKANGDFQTGTRSEVIKTDIRTVLQTRRFVNAEVGGERLMRPGFASVMPFTLIQNFVPEIMGPFLEMEVRNALQFLENELLIRVDEVRIVVQEFEDRAGLIVQIFYTDLVDFHREDYEFEILSQTISEIEGTV